jgi:S1-C subfamily serine protease
VARPELVVTNAHVVAGEDDTTVTTRAGTTLDASPVHFEPRNDLAILRVPGLDAPSLPLSPQVPPGTAGAVLGYPENGSFTVSPVRMGRTGRVVSQDSYGRGPVEREMTPFRGRVRSGNSGGPAVDGTGRVLTTVFAAQEGHGSPGGLGVPNRAVRRALRKPLRAATTGPCSVCGPPEAFPTTPGPFGKLTRGWSQGLLKRRALRPGPMAVRHACRPTFATRSS